MAGTKTGGRNRAAAFLAVSLFAAVGASAMIYNVMESLQQELKHAQEREARLPVVSAKYTLYPGDTIAEEDLEYVSLEEAYIPPTNTFSDFAQVVGRVPLERILPHELVRVERLARPEAGHGMPALIPPGMRATSLRVTDASAVGGFLNPGNYVDVLVTIQSADKNSRANMTVTALSAVKVLAVNSSMGGITQADSRSSAPSVTLAVTPEEAEKVVHAISNGAVSLTLRNDLDSEQAELEPTTLVDLIGGAVTPIGDVEPSETARRKGVQEIMRVDPPDEPAPAPRYIRGSNVQGG